MKQMCDAKLLTHCEPIGNYVNVGVNFNWTDTGESKYLNLEIGNYLMVAASLGRPGLIFASYFEAFSSLKMMKCIRSPPQALTKAHSQYT